MRIATLGKIFNIFPQSLFLVGSNGTVATPDEEGDFDTYDMSRDAEWTVSGDSSKPSATDLPSRSTNSPYAYQSQQPEASQPSTSKYAKAGSKAAKWRPSLSLSMMRNKPPGVAKQEGLSRKPGKGHGEAWTKTIEICTYDDSTYAMRKTLNLPITLSEKTASVNRVAEIVSFEGEEVVLLDSDNLKIPDRAGTRGM
jgi:hypothetical protein